MAVGDHARRAAPPVSPPRQYRMDFQRPAILRLFPCATLAIIVCAVVLSFIGADGGAAESDAVRTTPAAKPVDVAAVDASARIEFAAFAEQYCTECHQGDNPDGQFFLNRLITSEATLAHAKGWIKVATALKSGHMPPGEEEQPPETARRQAIVFVEQQTANIAAAADPDPGRVTIRRLTRHEYRNTIRDLVGVDFKAATDFPGDDVGYGFDNIGDILTMPPLLMQKYLSAAEKILNEAIVTEKVIQPEMTYIPPEQLKREPRMESDPGWLTEHGDVYFDFEVPHDGVYKFRVFASGVQAGPDLVQMGVKVNGATQEVFELRNNRHYTDKHEVSVTLKRGKHRFGAEFLNDYWNPDAKKRSQRDRNLAVRSCELEGPFNGKPRPIPATHRRIFFTEPSKTQTPEATATTILEQFAGRAFRRPATDEELARLMKLFQVGQAAGDTFEASVEVALSAVLVSPQFLFRVERDHPATEPLGAYRISDFELASRLSYFLWSTMPDDELIEVADAGQLSQPEQLDAQITRMLQSPKAGALVDNFAAQWLQLRRLDDVQPDTQQFAFDEELRQAMYHEVAALFEAVMREDRSIHELLDADYTFLNERLATHYGIAGVRGPEMRRVELTDARRGGVLTSAAVLTVTSNPSRTSPVKRGKWILEQLLGIKNESPADVPPLDEQPQTAETGQLSLRERLKQHTADPSCAACHLRLDPMGFSLENYDAVGRWRTKDGELPIDATATMADGTEFTGPAGLRKILSQRKGEYTRCLAEAMLTFALGRGLEPYDGRAVQRIAEQTAADDFRFSSLVRGVVHSYPFQYRRPLHEEEVENE